MAVTDWQLWVHLLLFWPVVGPGEYKNPRLGSVSEINTPVQLTGLVSSYPLSPRSLDIRLPFPACSLFHRISSQVS